MRWRSWCRPGAADLVFAVVLLTTLLGDRSGLLDDPGTFWHLRLGRDILASGRVPGADALTFTRAGEPWVDQSWAFDVGLALVVDRGGWPWAVALASLGLAALYGALASGLVRDGRSPLAAGVVAILAAGVGSIHFLVRPHLATLALVLVTLRACRAYRERGGRALWVLPPAMVAWANLHGGFLAGPLIVATAAVGQAASGPWDAERRRRVLGFALAVGAMLAASLANPYGLGLYRHVFGLLVSSRVTDLIQEYQPAPFGTGTARVLEWMILALIALPALQGRRVSRYDLAHALVWLHLALGSIRHAPLFALAAAPALAWLVDGLIEASRSGEVVAEPPGRGGWSLATPLVAALAVALALGLRPAHPNPARWPLAALPALDARPAALPLFHELEWGGLIAAECRPARRSFLDDRFELYGREAILEYADALVGGPAWDAIRDRHGIALAWLKPDRGLARRLEADPSWEVVYRDTISVLFARRAPPPAVGSPVPSTR